MSTSFDAVVIGGGHNGLAAAIHLAKSGMSVALVERNQRLGGAIATDEVTLPGFRHDLYAMNLSLFAGSPFAQAYGADLAAHGLAYVPAADCFASPFGDRWLGVSTDAEATASRIDALQRGGRRALARDDGGLRRRRGALFRDPRRADAAFLARRPLLPDDARQGADVDVRGDPPPPLQPARFPRRQLHLSRGEGPPRPMGNASRLSARCLGRRDVPLSRGDGGPGVRHGARQGRRRRGAEGDGRPLRSARRRGPHRRRGDPDRGERRTRHRG